MIYINLDNFLPNDDWRNRVRLLNASLRKLHSQEARNRFIEENRSVWNELKDQLPFNNKCWYSEAKESVSIYEIEHFRPIRAIKRCKSVLRSLKTFVEEQRRDWTADTHYTGVGYWWLAFDYKNYRICGKKINSIKGNRFPIAVNSPIAYSEDEEIMREQHLLLDPTKQGDPDLLTFDPDGKARPTKTDVGGDDYIRAFVSIDVYGLNTIEPLVIHRQAKWAACCKAIRRAQQKFDQVKNAAEKRDLATYFKCFDEFMDYVDNDIIPAINNESEFSSVAKACLLSFSSYEWIQKYVIN